jgi:hypothetical protein
MSDGGENVRRVQEYLQPYSEHLIDRFHISMRATALQQQTKALEQERPQTGAGKRSKRLDLHSQPSGIHSELRELYLYRQGETITTSFVESTINQVVSKRFVKKQQMAWTIRGAHLLLQTRRKSSTTSCTRCSGDGIRDFELKPADPDFLVDSRWPRRRETSSHLWCRGERARAGA